MNNDLLYELSTRLAQQCDCLGYGAIDIDLLSKINTELGENHIDITNLIKYEIPSYIYETQVKALITKRHILSKLCNKIKPYYKTTDDIDFSSVSFEVVEDFSSDANTQKKKYLKRLIIESPWPLDENKALAVVRRALCLSISEYDTSIEITSSQLKNY